MTKTERFKPYIYVSGPLSGLNAHEFARVTAIYDVIARATEATKLTAYCPHRTPTAPGQPMEPTEVWRTDFARVVKAALVVAYVGIPSLGVGSEIEMARAARVPVILVCEADRVPRVSRLALGSPAVIKVLPFENPEHLRRLIESAIPSVDISQRLAASGSTVDRLATEVLAAAKYKARHKATLGDSSKAGSNVRRRSA